MIKPTTLLIYSSFLLPQSTLAVPLSHLSSSTSFLSLTTNESFIIPSPFLSKPTNTSHLPQPHLTTPHSLNHTSSAGPGHDWVRHITEGFFKITSSAPDAYLVGVKSSSTDEIWARGTNDVADLHSLWVTCYDPEHDEHLFTHGQIDPTTKEASWAMPERTQPDVSVTHRLPQLHWLPDHDIAQAVGRAIASEYNRFNSVEYCEEEYRNREPHQVFRFWKVDGGWWEVDVETLKVLAGG